MACGIWAEGRRFICPQNAVTFFSAPLSGGDTEIFLYFLFFHRFPVVAFALGYVGNFGGIGMLGESLGHLA